MVIPVPAPITGGLPVSGVIDEPGYHAHNRIFTLITSAPCCVLQCTVFHNAWQTLLFRVHLDDAAPLAVLLTLGPMH